MLRRNRLAAAGLLASFSACTYAWPTGTSPLDASADGPTDASLVDHLPDALDSAADVTADSQPPPDAGPDAANPCVKLHEIIASTRLPAKQCHQGTSFCAVKITDECSCDTFIDEAGTQNVIAYQKAVANFIAAGCAIQPFCPPVGGCSASGPGCILSSPEAGFVPYCFPQGQ